MSATTFISPESPPTMNAHSNITTAASSSKQENADNYARVMFLSPDGMTRIIACRDNRQWIVQTRAPMDSTATTLWRSKSYCMSQVGMMLVTRTADFATEAMQAFVEGLPSYFPSKAAR